MPSPYFVSAVAAADGRSSKLRILLVVSEPIDEPIGTNAAQEIRHLYQQLTMTSVPAALIRLNPPTWSYLQMTLLAGHFEVVHFIGHARQDALQLEREDGTADWVSAEDLAPLFADSGVKLVVLNNCSSEPIGDTLVGTSVPAVVAAPRAVHSEAALLLVGPLYSALSMGQTPKAALGIVKRSLRRELGQRASQVFTALGPNSDRSIVDVPLQKGEPEYFSCRPRHNLPPSRREKFFDRVAEHLRVHSCLAEGKSPFMGIYGIAGSGKSTVAVAAATRYSWRFPRGIAYASLRSMRPFSTTALLSHLGWGLEEVPTDRQLTVAAYELSQGAALVLLDDLESISEQESGEIVRLLRAWDTALGGRALLVMRTRRPEFDELIGSNWVSISDFPVKDALDFFTDQIGGLEIAREKLGTSLSRVPTLCHRHPKLLALTAAALQIGVPWEELRGQLEHLTGGPVAHVVNVLERSVSQVEKESPLAGQFLDCWSVFASAASEEAWRFVLHGRQLDMTDPLYQLQNDALAMMQRADILQRSQTDGGQNCRIHPLISEFVHKHRWTQLSEEKQAEYWRRHLEFHTRAIQTRGASYPIMAEWNNLSLALAAAEGAASWTSIVTLCLELAGPRHGVLVDTSLWSYCKEALGFGIRAARHIADTGALAGFLYSLGISQYRLAEYHDAVTSLNESLGLSDAEAQAALHLDVVRELGRLHYRLGQYESARERFSELLSTATRLDDKKLIGDALHELGRLAYREKNRTQAEELLSRALATREAAEDILGVARTLHEIGRLVHAAGRWTEAESAYHRSLGLRRETGDVVGQQATIHQLGLLEVDRGNFSAAHERYDECARISDALNDRFWIAHNLFRNADLSWREGDREKALGLASRAWELCKILGIALEREVSAWIDSHPGP